MFSYLLQKQDDFKTELAISFGRTNLIILLHLISTTMLECI